MGGMTWAWSWALWRAAFLRASLMRLMVRGSVGQVVHVTDCPAGVPEIDLVRLADEGREHGLVAQVVDDPRYPPARLVDGPERPRGERGPARAASQGQAVLDIVCHVAQ